MNVSVPQFDQGSPTKFAIAVNVDRVSFTVHKRYSDFCAFDEQIQYEMGEPTPAPLPPKKWVGNKNPQFLEDRRRGLELYLRAIIRRQEWRESLAFQQFLEVAKHAKESKPSTAVLRSQWLKDAEDARSIIASATSSMSSSSSTPSVSAQVRRAAVVAATKVKDLELALKEDSSLGEGEYRRRKDIVDELSRAAQTLTRPPLPGSSSSRSPSPSLFDSNTNATSNTTGRSRVLGAAAETNRTRDLDNRGILQLQTDQMQEQEAALEQLRATISRQRELGETINEELTYQNELLDDLDTNVHATNARLNQARRQVKKFT
uniref:ARAD1C09724p n=1 Tax=Blastobotrys adeninivorans TaxID=409370 RepID=A0A060T575_BLAAD